MAEGIKYSADMLPLIHKLCLLGLTNDEIAKALGTSAQIFEGWAKKNQELTDIIRQGKDIADSEVAMRLYQKAVGYRWMEQEAIKVRDSHGNEVVQVVDVQRQVAPDTVACIFWLKNRQRTKWRDKWDVVVQDPDGNKLPNEFIVKLVASNPPDDAIDITAHTKRIGNGKDTAPN